MSTSPSQPAPGRRSLTRPDELLPSRAVYPGSGIRTFAFQGGQHTLANRRFPLAESTPDEVDHAPHRTIRLMTTRRRGGIRSDRQSQFLRHRCSGCHSLRLRQEGPRLARSLRPQMPAHRSRYPVCQSACAFQDHNGMNSAREVARNTGLAVRQDNDMEFRVTNPEERRAFVAYLKNRC